MSRPIRALINCAALQHNFSVIRSHVGQSRIMAVVKADAYGHGLLRTARALDAADGFAVLELEAAIQLREAGFRQPVLLLEGFFSTEEIEVIRHYGLSTVIHCHEQLSMLLAHKETEKPDIFLKINTGMNRLGFKPEEGSSALRKLRQSCPNTNITLMTHFACADDLLETSHVEQQLNGFSLLQQKQKADIPRTLANSAAILHYPGTHADWVRPGIILYGASPLPDKTGIELGLRPVMTLTSRIIAVQHLEPSDRLGYGGSFVASQPIRVGVVAAGYADGYPRHAPTGTSVLVNGQRTRLIGRVSMDMLTVDLSGIPEAAAGSPVTLWGEGLPVEEVARSAQTISYELLAALSPRVQTVSLNC
ncbi:alanine racemase [Nitrosomonas sp.]|uniref:alanine racemase n=1 Tax=Nitrosomonas sp. TaxID=42353 RepID=UPI0025ED6D71|nr:alanine racemase [Nitrosomonas sp.]MCC6916861.1 alanine racemase [Nitrosomonas sp.]